MPKSHKTISGRSKSNKKAQARGRSKAIQKQRAAAKNSKKDAAPAIQGGNAQINHANTPIQRENGTNFENHPSDQNLQISWNIQRQASSVNIQSSHQIYSDSMKLIKSVLPFKQILEVVNINEKFQSGFSSLNTVNLFIPHLVCTGIAQPIPGSVHYIDPISLFKGHFHSGSIRYQVPGGHFKSFKLPTQPSSVPMPQIAAHNLNPSTQVFKRHVNKRVNYTATMGKVHYSHSHSTDAFDVMIPEFVRRIPLNKSAVRDIVLPPQLRISLPSSTNNNIYRFKFICDESARSDAYTQKETCLICDIQVNNPESSEVVARNNEKNIEDKVTTQSSIKVVANAPGVNLRIADVPKRRGSEFVSNLPSSAVKKSGNTTKGTRKLNKSSKADEHGSKGLRRDHRNNSQKISDGLNIEVTAVKPIQGMTSFSKAQQERLRQYGRGTTASNICGSGDAPSSIVEEGLARIRDASVFKSIPKGLFVNGCKCCRWIKTQFETSEYQLQEPFILMTKPIIATCSHQSYIKFLS